MERPWELKDLFWVLLLRLPSAPDQGALQAIEMCSLPGLEAGSQVWAALVPSGDSEERSHPGPSPSSSDENPRRPWLVPQVAPRVRGVRHLGLGEMGVARWDSGI